MNGLFVFLHIDPVLPGKSYNNSSITLITQRETNRLFVNQFLGDDFLFNSSQINQEIPIYAKNSWSL